MGLTARNNTTKLRDVCMKSRALIICFCDIYVGSRFENIPLSIMDDPASILRRVVPVLMTGPVNCGHFQYGDRDLVMFVDGLGMFFFW